MSENRVQYNPFAAETLEDPFPAYAELRQGCPLHQFDDYGPHPLYTATRYDDVAAMLTDIDSWSSHYGQMPRYSVQGCLFSDPPTHTWYRKLVQKSFAPRHVTAMEPEIFQLVTELLDHMAPRGEGDLHDDLACPLPVLIIAKILGVATDDIEQFKAWSDASLDAANDPDPAAREEPTRLIGEYFIAQLEARRRAIRAAGHDPATAPPEVLGDVIPDDVIGGLLVAESDGRRLGDPELLVMLNQLLVGGNETTTSLITNLFRRLLDEPALLAEIAANPELDAVAVEESLRLDAPVLGLYRTNTAERELHGVTLPERSKVMATFGAANRDPEVFDEPDRFRLDRDPAELRKHLAFGLGHHFCPGAHLSRLEARIALRLTIERLPGLRTNGPSERIGAYLLWGRRTLPVQWNVDAMPGAAS